MEASKTCKLTEVLRWKVHAYKISTKNSMTGTTLNSLAIKMDHFHFLKLHSQWPCLSSDYVKATSSRHNWKLLFSCIFSPSCCINPHAYVCFALSEGIHRINCYRFWTLKKTRFSMKVKFILSSLLLHSNSFVFMQKKKFHFLCRNLCMQKSIFFKFFFFAFERKRKLEKRKHSILSVTFFFVWKLKENLVLIELWIMKKKRNLTSLMLSQDD